MSDLWILQGKKKPAENWGNITAAIPYAEVLRYVEVMLECRQDAGSQFFYRAFCVNDDEKEYQSWQVFPDFPDFQKWVEVGKEAVMEDGSVWQKVR